MEKRLLIFLAIIISWTVLPAPRAHAQTNYAEVIYFDPNTGTVYRVPPVPPDCYEFRGIPLNCHRPTLQEIELWDARDKNAFATVIVPTAQRVAQSFNWTILLNPKQACGESSYQLAQALDLQLRAQGFQGWQVNQIRGRIVELFRDKVFETNLVVQQSVLLTSPRGQSYLLDVYSGSVHIARMSQVGTRIRPEDGVTVPVFQNIPEDTLNFNMFILPEALQLFLFPASLLPPIGPVAALEWDYSVGPGFSSSCWIPKVQSTTTIETVTSGDPNDKAGFQGAGASRYVSGETPLSYTIFFENEATATAPAQEVVITDQLDLAKMDLATVSLGPITFGSQQVVPPPGLHEFTTQVDLRPVKNLLVGITASLNPGTGLLTWRFVSIDPTTGTLTTDPLGGFLPPNTTPPAGEGSVFFTVRPKPGLPTGTEISNQATVVFDLNSPIATPVWMNTLDATEPDSQVLPLAATQTSPGFQVQWSGTDRDSGILDYTIFVSENQGPFTPWLTNTMATSGTFTGKSGKRYDFYSLARDQAGNQEEAKSAPEATTLVVGDTTPPTTTASASPPPNAHGWNSTIVTVTLTATDNPNGTGVKELSFALSGATTGGSTVAGSSAAVAISAEGTTTLTYFARDNAGNQEAAKTLTVSIDTTPPVLTCSLSPAPNSNGWNNTEVTVSFTAADALSGIASTPDPVTVSVEGANQAISGAATDNAGNSANTTCHVSLDKTPPPISIAQSPAPNTNGWNNTDVTMTFTASDALSGLDTMSGPVTVRTEGAGQIVRGMATDRAGNTANGSATINIDKTAPTLTCSLSPTPNVHGWNNTDVTVTFTASDALSGVATASGPVTVTAEGANQAIPGTATDQAGNMATATCRVSLDKTPPTISATRNPPPNGNGWNNTDVTVSFTASDSLSGLDTVSQPVTVQTEGADQVVSGVATDRAGNSASVSVGLNIDKTSPTIAGLPALGCMLWPPNHRLIQVATVTASDALSGVAPGSFGVTGASNEPENGLGDGDLAPDILISGGSVQLRAERAGNGSGRLYTLTATASDLADNRAQATATCTVPHDQSKK